MAIIDLFAQVLLALRVWKVTGVILT